MADASGWVQERPTRASYLVTADTDGVFIAETYTRKSH